MARPQHFALGTIQPLLFPRFEETASAARHPLHCEGKGLLEGVLPHFDDLCTLE